MPTSQIVKNVAEEVAGQPVRKNWVGVTDRHMHAVATVLDWL